MRDEFGTVPASAYTPRAAIGSRLHALQGGVSAQDIEAGVLDDSLAFYGLRDPAACADFAAAEARALIESGVSAREIAVLSGDDLRQIARFQPRECRFRAFRANYPSEMSLARPRYIWRWPSDRQLRLWSWRASRFLP